MSILSGVENYIKYIVPMEEEAYFHKSDKTDGGLRFHLFQMVIKLKEIRYYLVLTTNIGSM
jgi:hypothetical protein